MGKNKAKAPTLSCIKYSVNLTRSSRCNSSSRCCYLARGHVDPTWSREIRCGGDSHPETPSSPSSVGLARDHPLTKTQATEPSRQTRSSYGPLYPLGRWSPLWIPKRRERGSQWERASYPYHVALSSALISKCVLHTSGHRDPKLRYLTIDLTSSSCGRHCRIAPAVMSRLQSCQYTPEYH